MMMMMMMCRRLLLDCGRLWWLYSSALSGHSCSSRVLRRQVVVVRRRSNGMRWRCWCIQEWMTTSRAGVVLIQPTVETTGVEEMLTGQASGLLHGVTADDAEVVSLIGGELLGAHSRIVAVDVVGQIAVAAVLDVAATQLLEGETHMDDEHGVEQTRGEALQQEDVNAVQEGGYQDQTLGVQFGVVHEVAALLPVASLCGAALVVQLEKDLAQRM
mmetsp:Transcript_13496/g.40722  ORF Transcript_13496/g.40722 Transcript_13496/m.40722 type:complete len:215 (+) Transcript_13496:2-646(+)